MTQHIQRSNNGGKGSCAKPRAHTGKKKGAGCNVRTEGKRGELLMDLLMTTGKRIQH